MRAARRLTIRGQKWRIVFGRPPANKCEAYCDPNIRTIWIRTTSTTTPEQKRARVIHEILHACFCDMEEAAIEEAEEALVRGLELVPFK